MKFSKESLPLLVMAIIIFLLGGALGGMFVKIQYLEGKAGVVPSAVVPSGAQNQQPTAPSKVDPKVTAEDPVRGDPNAKLTIVNFADYQCPFCGKFHSDVENKIIKDYVDTGKVKFVYKNLAFLGQESKDAANAALCAKEQNKFWEFHDKLFTSQSGENQGAFSVTNLKKFAVDLGLNSDLFNKCLDTKKYNAQVEADNAEASRIGFQSTPSTAVGSIAMIGALPYEQFKATIDAQLNLAK